MKPFESIGESLAGRLSLESYPAQGFPSWKVSHLLKHLESAVGGPKRRRIGKSTPNELVVIGVKIGRADLEALERLRRVALRGAESHLLSSVRGVARGK